MSQSHIVSAVPLLLVLLLVLPCYHSARILNDFPSTGAAATHLALPTDELLLSPEKHSGGLPCEMGVLNNNNNYHPETQRLPGKYYGRPLYLGHVLPKGTTPPSGPSKGINGVKN